MPRWRRITTEEAAQLRSKGLAETRNVVVDQDSGDLAEAGDESESKLGFAARSIGGAIGPLLGGRAIGAGAGALLGGGAGLAGGPAAPATVPLGVTAGVIGGNILGGLAASGLQEYVLKGAANRWPSSAIADFQRRREGDIQAHPYASMLTSLGASPAGGGGLMTIPSTLKRAAQMGGLQAGIDLPLQYATIGEYDPMRGLIAAGSGAFQSTPNRSIRNLERKVTSAIPGIRGTSFEEHFAPRMAPEKPQVDAVDAVRRSYGQQLRARLEGEQIPAAVENPATDKDALAAIAAEGMTVAKPPVAEPTIAAAQPPPLPEALASQLADLAAGKRYAIPLSATDTLAAPEGTIITETTKGKILHDKTIKPELIKIWADNDQLGSLYGTPEAGASPTVAESSVTKPASTAAETTTSGPPKEVTIIPPGTRIEVGDEVGNHYTVGQTVGDQVEIIQGSSKQTIPVATLEKFIQTTGAKVTQPSAATTYEAPPASTAPKLEIKQTTGEEVVPAKQPTPEEIKADLEATAADPSSGLEGSVEVVAPVVKKPRAPRGIVLKQKPAGEPVPVTSAVEAPIVPEKAATVVPPPVGKPDLEHLVSTEMSQSPEVDSIINSMAKLENSIVVAQIADPLNKGTKLQSMLQEFDALAARKAEIRRAIEAKVKAEMGGENKGKPIPVTSAVEAPIPAAVEPLKPAVPSTRIEAKQSIDAAYAKLKEWTAQVIAEPDKAKKAALRENFISMEKSPDPIEAAAAKLMRARTEGVSGRITSDTRPKGPIAELPESVTKIRTPDEQRNRRINSLMDILDAERPHVAQSTDKIFIKNFKKKEKELATLIAEREAAKLPGSIGSGIKAAMEKGKETGAVLNPATLIKNFVTAAKAVIERKVYGIREEKVDTKSYVARWRNGSARWSVIAGGHKRKDIERPKSGFDTEGYKRFRALYPRGLPDYLPKGSIVDLDSNEIVIPADSLDNAIGVADRLPVLPLYGASFEQKPGVGALAKLSPNAALLKELGISHEDILAKPDLSGAIDSYMDFVNAQKPTGSIGAGIQKALGKQSEAGAVRLPSLEDVKGAAKRVIGAPFKTAEYLGIKQLYAATKGAVQRKLATNNPLEYRLVKQYEKMAIDAAKQAPFKQAVQDMKSDLSSKEIDRISDYLYAKKHNQPSDIKPTEKELEHIATHREIEDTLGMQKSMGAYITDFDSKGNRYDRPFQFSENYATEAMNPRARRIINNATARQDEYNALKRDFVDFQEQQGRTRELAAKIFEELKTPVLPDGTPNPEFKGNRFALGVGLPKSMRMNAIDALDREISRHFQDYSWHKNIESDVQLAKGLGRKDMGRNNPVPEEVLDDAGVPIESGILQNEDTSAMLKDYLGYSNPKAQAIEKTTSAIVAPLVSTWSAVRDVASVFSIAGEHASVPQQIRHALPAIADAFNKSVKHEAMTEGAIRARGNASMTVLDDAEDGVKKILDTFRTGTHRITGTERITQGLRQFAYAFGKRIATDKLLSGDEKFLERWGPLNWREEAAKDPGALTRYMAARLVGDMQGTYGAEGLPNWALKSGDNPVLQYVAPLARWSIERFNRWYRNVYEPAKDGNVGPLLKTLTGAMFITTPMINYIKEQITEAKPREMTWEEYLKLGGKDTAYELFSRAETAGYGGILSSLAFNAIRKLYGETPQGFGQPAFQLGSDILERASQWGQHWRNGEADISDIPTYAAEAALQQVQILRMLNTQKPTGEREENIARRVGVLPPEDKGDYGVRDPLSMSGAYRSNDSERLAKIFRSRINSAPMYPTRNPLPRPTSAVRPDPNYYRFIAELQGPEAARAAMERDKDTTMKKREIFQRAAQDATRR